MKLFLPSRNLKISISFIALAIVVTFCKTPSANIPVADTSPVVNPNGRNDTWGFVGFGGGGATFNPAISPHNSNMAFVSCDMTGSFATRNGGDSWRMFSLRGVTRSYVFDPLDSMVVYSVVQGHASGLYKSTNAGDSWTLLYPAREEVVGILAKGDHGDEVMVMRDSTQRSFLALAVDPDNSDRLYAAIEINKSNAFYTSTDGGQHWVKEKDLEEPTRNIYVVPGSPAESRLIYITGKNTIAVRKNGAWAINKGPQGVKSMTEFAGGFDSKSKTFIMYATAGKSYFDPAGEVSGIYFTDNGGATWHNRQSGLTGLTAKNMPIPEYRSIATSALHPEVVYVSYANLKVHPDTTCIGVAKSVDFGMTWKLMWRDNLVEGADTHAANLEGGWINERYGPTWGENPFSIAVSAVDPDVTYNTDFGRVIKTEDGGETWTQVYTKRVANGGWTSRGLEVTCSYGVIFDPFDARHMFITNTDVGLMESHDRGKSWSSATKDTAIPKQWINSTYWLAFDPEVKGKAWAAMTGIHDLPRPKMWRRMPVSKFNGGIVETEDGGKTWKPVSQTVGEGAMTHIMIDPTSDKAARTLYACAFGKGVYKSVDGGKTWRQKNKGIAGKEPFAWRIIRRDDGILYLIVSRRSDDGSIGNELDGALYTSNDGAETWEKITLPPGTNAPTSLVVDPQHPGRLLLSAWGLATSGHFSPDTGGGIFVSDDNGVSWTPVLPQDQHIHDLSYDPRIRTFYACGFTGSAYKSLDGKIWDRIPGYNFKWGRRVDMDPADPEKIFILTFGGGVWYGPAAGDPNAVEDILNPLPVR